MVKGILTFMMIIHGHIPKNSSCRGLASARDFSSVLTDHIAKLHICIKRGKNINFKYVNFTFVLNDALKYQEESHNFTSRFARLLIGSVSVSSGCVQNKQCLSYSLKEMKIPSLDILSIWMTNFSEITWRMAARALSRTRVELPSSDLIE